MASNTEGWYIKANVDISSLLQANKSANQLFETIKKVDAGFSNLHGNDALAKSIKSADLASASYIERLKSEGKEYQANQETVKLYSRQIEQLTAKQKQLQSSLDEVAQKSGKTSDAYNVQKARINETATSINRLKGNIDGLNKEMREANPTFLDRIKGKLTSTNEEAHKTHSVFTQMFGAFTLGNLASGAFNKVKDSLGGMFTEAKEYAQEQQTMNATWLTLTGNASKGQAMVKQINDMATSAQNSVEMVDTLSQKFYAINKSASQTGKLTKSLLTLQDAFGASDASVENFGVQFSQMMANGKVSGQDMLSIVNTFPELRTRLRDYERKITGDAKLSSKDVSNLISKGKISSQDMINVVYKTADSYKNATGNFTKTIPGMTRVIRTQWKNLIGNMASPLEKMKSPFYGAVAKWVSSKQTQKLFNQLGKTVSKGMSTVLKAFSGSDRKKIMSGLDSALIGLNKTIGKTFGWIAAHAKDFKEIGGAIGRIVTEIGKSVWKDFSPILQSIGRMFGVTSKNGKDSGGALHAIAGILDNISRNKLAIKAVSDYIVLMASIKMSKAAFSPLLSLAGKGFRGFQNAGALFKGLKGIKDVEGLSETASKYLKAGNTIRKAGGIIKTAGKGTVGAIKWTAKGIAFAGKSFGKSFLNQLKIIGSGIKGLGKLALNAVKGVGSKFLEAGKFLGTKLAQGIKATTKFSMGKRLATGAVAGVAVATPEVMNAVKDRHSANKRSQDIGGAVGAVAGGALTSMIPVVGPMLAPIGAIIGKYAGRWGGQAVNKFTKGWQSKKPPKKFWSLANLGWSAHSMWNGFISSVGKTIKWFKKNWKEIGVYFVSPLAGAINSLYKHNPKFRKWVNGLVKSFRNAWNNVAKWFGNLWNGTIKTFKSLWSNLGKFFGGIADGFKKSWNGVVSFFEGIWKKVEHIVDPIIKAAKIAGGWIGGAVKGVKNTAKNVWNKVTGKSHANGGRMATNHGALVGEAGPELAYKPYANNVRLLGANGPEFTKVHAGEHILNAKDTAKVMAGGLGQGTVLRGYANGNTKLNKTAKSVKKNYSSITKDSSKELNKLVKTSQNSWLKINKQTTGQTTKTRKNAIKDYTTMKTKVSGQMDNMHKSVVKTAKSTATGFGNALNKMKGYAKDAMSDTIAQLNKGISGIDKVLGQFGGNGSVIKPIHFATGSGGELPHNTLAMVNDDITGPRQEAIVRDNNLLIPHGQDRVIPLRKGDQVLNGYQTQQLAHSWGLQHFAKGSGVSHSQLRKIASQGLANPSASFAKMFTSAIHSSGSELHKGTTELGANASTHYGNPWSLAMWTVINDAISDSAGGKGGTRESFLKYAESTFSGVKYVMGAASKLASDCSGMVMQALRHYGIDIGRTTVAMQESSGVQYLGKNLAKTLPGDLVIFGHGTGAAGHVGIIKDPKRGTMFNETPPYARVTNIATDKGMGYGYYRVRGLHNAQSSSNKPEKADKRLMTLAKNELGARAIKWIKDNLGDDFGSLGNFSIKGDLASRARALAAGLKKLDPRATKNGIAAVLGNWNFESGGLNPGAVNSSGGASGLGQWLGGRKSNLIAYARRHGTGWKNAGTQLSFAVKGEGSDSAILRSVLEGHGSVADLARKFSQLWERGGYDEQHVKGAMEIRKALGFAKGGDHHDSTPFIAGENGPELITANGPVHIDTHEQTKRKVRDLSREVNVEKVDNRRLGNTPININLNFSGNISSDRDMHKMANIAKQEVVNALEQLFGRYGGADPSLY